MPQSELKQCLFCGAVGPDVCEGLTPKTDCKKPGLSERIAAHTRTPVAPEKGKIPDSE